MASPRGSDKWERKSLAVKIPNTTRAPVGRIGAPRPAPPLPIKWAHAPPPAQRMFMFRNLASGLHFPDDLVTLDLKPLPLGWAAFPLVVCGQWAVGGVVAVDACPRGPSENRNTMTSQVGRLKLSSPPVYRKQPPTIKIYRLPSQTRPSPLSPNAIPSQPSPVPKHRPNSISAAYPTPQALPHSPTADLNPDDPNLRRCRRPPCLPPPEHPPRSAMRTRLPGSKTCRRILTHPTPPPHHHTTTPTPASHPAPVPASGTICICVTPATSPRPCLTQLTSHTHTHKCHHENKSRNRQNRVLFIS